MFDNYWCNWTYKTEGLQRGSGFSEETQGSSPSNHYKMRCNFVGSVVWGSMRTWFLTGGAQDHLTRFCSSKKLSEYGLKCTF